MKRLQVSARRDSTDSESEKNVKKKSNTTAAAKSSKFRPQFLSLKESMSDKTIQVFKSDRFVCIRDKYPKSRFHLLLIPTLAGVELLKVSDLINRSDSLSLLDEMKELSDRIVKEKLPAEFQSRVNVGFHSIQSMSPLHMHIITNDFKSECLKNKKHWNSFNTPYFINLVDLIDHVKSKSDSDKFNLNNSQKLKSYLDTELKCNICHAVQSNMPKLKQHLLTH